MTGELILLLTAFLIHLSSGVDTNSQINRPSHQFILLQCIARAELIRKQRNEESTNSKLDKPTGNLLQRQQSSLTMKIKNSTFQESSTFFPPNFESKNNLLNTTTMNTDVKTTPLKTLNIKSIRRSLPIFRRKSLLPELDHNSTNENGKSSKNIIVIKTVA